MEFLRVCLCVLLPAASVTAAPERRLSAEEYANSRTARAMDADVAAIERSEPHGWRHLAGYAYRVDGEYGEAFGAACSFLVRRDPTVFLRRHLAGDPDALCCGWFAYRGSDDYRTVLDAVYRYRLLEASSEQERAQIQDFIARTRDQNRQPRRLDTASQRKRPARR